MTIENHPIPPITDPLGRWWTQPSREDILIDATHAVMSSTSLDKLSNYSTTLPTGKYPGKMWRGYSLVAQGWYLRWYGAILPETNEIEIHHREILLVD